jgi:hypothetical protein
MARKRGRIFKYGIQGVLTTALAKIDASKEAWAERTKAGFQTYWSDWMSFILPGLTRTVAALPPKTASVRLNVINRVVPVATYIHRMATAYKRRLMVAPPAVAPVTPPTPPATAPVTPTVPPIPA